MLLLRIKSNVAFPPSRSISPEEQLKTMVAIEESLGKIIKEPSSKDIERYQYYIDNGPDKSMIAPLPGNQFEIFYNLISPRLKSKPFTQVLAPILAKEILNDYEYSMRKAILDYVLLSHDERQRLKIEWIQRPFAQK